MNKKHLRTLSTLLLAIVMIFTMSLSVFAADNEFNGGTAKGQTQDNADRSGESLGTNNTLIFEKGIKLVDADDKFYIPNVPNLVFTYAVAPADVAENTKVSDGLAATTVRQGVGTVGVSAVDNANEFDNGVKFTNDNGSSVITNVGTDADPVYIATEKLKLNFTNALSAATQPGVYRYKITETAILKDNDANKGYDYSGDVSVTKDDVRYVDMYVRWKADDPTKLEIYGYTMFKGDPTYNPTDVPKDITASVKTDGFTYDKSTTSVTLKEDKTAEDERKYTVTNDLSGITTYTTYDLVVRKTVSGAMADKSREFDIDVLIDKLPKDDKVYYKANAEATYTSASDAITALKVSRVQTAVGGGATEGGTVGNENKVSVNGMPKLKHDQYAVIKGIPSGAGSTTPTKYDVMEESAATKTDGYTMSFKKNSISEADPSDSYTDNIVANHGNIASGQTDLTATFEMAKAASTNAFYVDNNLKAISPTNVVMRVAPYLFILGAGIMLLMVSRRRKAEQE